MHDSPGDEERTLASLGSVVQTVIRSLPAHAGAVEEAFAESSYFRSMCKDFHACSRVLTYWNEKTSDDAAKHREEYRELRREIQQEIVDWLEARGTGSVGG